MLKTTRKKYFLNLGYLIIFSLFLIGVYYVSVYGYKNKVVGEEAFRPGALPKDKTLIFSSFFDSFSNGLLINEPQSNLYRDNLASAVYFPPLYTWETADAWLPAHSLETADADLISQTEERLNKIYLNEFSDPLNSSDRRCLDKNCLEQKGISLNYKGKSLALPQDIKGAAIVGLTIGALEKTWLIGVTIKEGDTYEGRVYFFDGAKFTPLVLSENSKKISSPYFGLFGFGGRESDFLVIYGAYRGMAYHLQNNDVIDISRFFDYRVMDKGFRPEIIKAASNWYIFSSSLHHPRLLKLWSNSAGQISGEVVYTDGPLEGGEALPFLLLKADNSRIDLLSKTKNINGLEELFVFSDLGFENNFLGQIYFQAVMMASEINIKKIAHSSLGSKDSPCPEGSFFFSRDNKIWQELPLNQPANYDFVMPDLSEYYLRVDFPAQENKFYSPFLTEVLFDVYYQK